jgi:hypothetical protein
MSATQRTQSTSTLRPADIAATVVVETQCGDAAGGKRFRQLPVDPVAAYQILPQRRTQQHCFGGDTRGGVVEAEQFVVATEVAGKGLFLQRDHRLNTTPK